MALHGLHITRQDAAIHECRHGQHFLAGAVFALLLDRWLSVGWVFAAVVAVSLFMIWREDRIVRWRIAEGPIYNDPIEPREEH